MKWHIGCSGFSYKHWKEIFYPKNVPQRSWFEYYCEHFKTLELNVTFYRFPTEEMLKGWYRRSPDDFSFSVKAPRLITHYKKLADTSLLIDEFYQLVENGLQEKGGAFLFQFPPNFHFSTENLEKVITNLDPRRPNVAEFRHGSWWNPDVYDQLGKNNISFSGMSHPKLPADVIQNAPLLYHRMHGTPLLYDSPYSLDDLKKLADLIQKEKKVKEAFIFFNNDIGGSAITNAKELMSLVGKKKLLNLNK